MSENYNPMIRRFIPKGRSFDSIDQETLNRINNWIDTYPENDLATNPQNKCLLKN